jgi:hypothetical protein
MHGDAELLVLFGRAQAQAVQLLAAEKVGLGQRRPLVRQPVLGRDQDYLSFEGAFPQRGRRGVAGRPASGDDYALGRRLSPISASSARSRRSSMNA